MKKLNVIGFLFSLMFLFLGCVNNATKEDEPVVKAETLDCNIEETDLGEWSGFVNISSDYFSEMIEGDYLLIESITNGNDSQNPQLQFVILDGTDEKIGDRDSLSNATYVSEWECYDIIERNQISMFKPSLEEISRIKESGLMIKGKGLILKSVKIRINAYIDDLEAPLSDENATTNAKRLYSFILRNYGHKVITGQMENAWNNDFNQLGKVYNDTNKYPALMGFDFMDYTVQWAIDSGFNKQTERAINFWNGKDYSGKKISDSNGIVAFCWHWFEPLEKNTYKPEETSFRIPYDLKTSTWKTSSIEYKEMIKDLDVIAKELIKLQSAGVPVIWRPFHEGAGNVGQFEGGVAWFWWGAGTCAEDATNLDKCGKAYIALWRLMYDYFTETKGIHNLIWMWNGENAKFYPGDDYVDMIGKDIYVKEKGDYSSRKTEFNNFQKINTKLPVALTECGLIPSLENMKKDRAMWSYFMVWNDSSNDNTNADNFWNGENHNPKDHKLDIYNSSLAITLDDVGRIAK